MLTVKSDDVIGRAKTFEAIVKGSELSGSTVPESFKVLIKELNSLSLDIIPIDTLEAKEEKIEEEEEKQGEEKKEDEEKGNNKKRNKK